MRIQEAVAFVFAGVLVMTVPVAAQTPAPQPPPGPAPTQTPPTQTPPAPTPTQPTPAPAPAPPQTPTPPAAPAPAAPQVEAGNDPMGWSLFFDIGMDTSLSGDVYGRGQGNLLLQPVQVSARSYGRAYNPGLAWSVGLGRGLSDRSELRIRVVGFMGKSDRRQTGRVGSENLTGTLFAEVGDLTEIGADVGFRRYFGGGTVQPYVGAQLGVARVNAISVALDVPDGAFPFQSNLDLYSASTAFTAGGHGGFLFKTSDRLGVYVNLDVRFRSKLEADDAPDLQGTGFEGINDDSSRWHWPLSAGLRLGF